MIRALLSVGALAFASPGPPASVSATPATLPAIIAAAQPGSTINLAPGVYGPVTIKRTFAQPITINAGRSMLRGLVITGGGVRWRSGTLAATGGREGFAGAGYAIKISGSNVRLDGVLVTDAKKGIVLDGGSDITIADSQFLRLGEDGIIAAKTVGLTIVRNRFAETIGKPTSCAAPAGIVMSLSRRDCTARGGAWTDGFHPDAIQIRNGITDALIADNVIDGSMQGIGQMEAPTDAPLVRVTIRGNRVAVTAFHTITLAVCGDCTIRGNIVRRGGPAKAIIRAGTARRCENDVQDDKPDGRC